MRLTRIFSLAVLIAIAASASASCSTINGSAPAAGPSRCNGMPDADAAGFCDGGG